MWNDIKKFFATTNWKALVFAAVAQWMFFVVVWCQLFHVIFSWGIVGTIIRAAVDVGVFIMAYVWFAERYPKVQR
jgi:hypothetical protein